MLNRKDLVFLENNSIKETKRCMKDINPFLFTLGLFFIMQLGSGIFIGFTSYFLKDPSSGQSLESYIMTSDYFPILSLLSTLFVSVLVYLFVKFFQKRTNRSLGFGSPQGFRDYFRGLVFGLLILSLSFILAYIFGGYKVSLNIDNINIKMFLLFIIGWIFQGFEEEFITRAILMNYFAARSGIGAGIVINSLVFAILHLGNSSFSIIAFINLFLVGLVFSMLFYLTDSIYTSAAAHSVWNFLQANVFGINVSGIINTPHTIFRSEAVGKDIISGGGFGIEASLVVSLILILSLYFLYNKAKSSKLIIKG